MKVSFPKPVCKISTLSVMGCGCLGYFDWGNMANAALPENLYRCLFFKAVKVNFKTKHCR